MIDDFSKLRIRNVSDRFFNPAAMMLMRYDAVVGDWVAPVNND